MDADQTLSVRLLAVTIRDRWTSKVEYFLTVIGYAIGVGNVWRFPYLCYRSGGGAFFIPYFLMLVLCGIPLFFMETSLGQFSSASCISIYKICPLFKGAGYAMVIVNFICSFYYNVIISYPILLLYNSFSKELPWSTCNNTWNSPNCTLLDTNKQTANITKGDKLTPANEFFHNEILKMSSTINHMGGLVWPLFICNILSWIFIYLCVMRGVKSVGKVVYFTATFPILLMGVMLIRGVTLDGAIEGVKYFIVPKWENLLSIKVWGDAAIQIFFSLGPGWGGIITAASFNEFHNNSETDALILPLVNVIFSIFGGFAIFSILGFMAVQVKSTVQDVAIGGPGLAFVTYPEALSLMPFPQLWAFLFFFMLYTLGIDSLFVQIEAIICSLVDEFPVCRKYKSRVTILAIFFLWLASLLCVTNAGMYYLQLFDWYATSIPVICVCYVNVIIIGWIYGADRYHGDLEFMIGKPLSRFYPICWRYVTPIFLTCILICVLWFNTTITYNDQPYPTWAVLMGWGSCLLSIICIPIYAIYSILRAEGTFKERIKKLTTPRQSWGPANPIDRQKWMEYTNAHL